MTIHLDRDRVLAGSQEVLPAKPSLFTSQTITLSPAPDGRSASWTYLSLGKRPIRLEVADDEGAKKPKTARDTRVRRAYAFTPHHGVHEARRVVGDHEALHLAMPERQARSVSSSRVLLSSSRALLSSSRVLLAFSRVLLSSSRVLLASSRVLFY